MKEQPEGTTRREFVAATAGAAMVAAFGFNRLARAEDTALITQTVTFKIKPGKEEEAVAALQKLTKAVEENEPGVLAYAAHRAEKDPSKVVFFEVYANEDAVAAHRTQPHMQEMFPKFQELFEGGMQIERLDRVAGYTRKS